MNAKQSLRLASKRIEELEHFNRSAAADIVDYNRVIEHMISGGCPCDWCEDMQECQLNAKGETGCTDWMLRSREVSQCNEH